MDILLGDIVYPLLINNVKTRTEDNAIIEADDCSHDHKYRLLSVLGCILIGSFICGRVRSTLVRSNNMFLNGHMLGKQQSLRKGVVRTSN
jgi:hypothetical protein